MTAAKKTTTKRKMSQLEADWHSHAAGVKASAKARTGESTLGIDALNHSTPAVIKQVGGWDLKPATVGTWIEDAQVAAYLESLGAPESKLAEMILNSRWLAMRQLLFADALRFRRLRETEGWDAIIAEADRINYELPPEDRIKLAEHMGHCMALVNSLTDSGPTPEAAEPATGTPGK